MPLSLHAQLSQSAFRHILMPALAICLAGTGIIGSLIFFQQRDQEAKVVTGSLSALEQRLVTGDFVALQQMLDSLSKSLSFDVSMVTSPEGRIVASFPEVEALHLPIREWQCPSKELIRNIEGAVVGKLCWVSSGFRRGMYTALIVLTIFIPFVILLFHSYHKVRTVLFRHADELDLLSRVLSFGSSNSDSNVLALRASSQESERLLEAIDRFSKSTTALTEAKKDAERAASLEKLARQVAHDIRSPLSAMSVVSQMADGLTPDQRALIRAATHRIEEMANDLIKRHSGDERTPPTDTFLQVIEQIVEEKRAEYREHSDLKFVVESHSMNLALPSAVEPWELARVLSNLINNAVEATEESAGEIRIGLFDEPLGPTIQVSDSGKGISPEIISRVCDFGFTAGKRGGTGLGLSHAKESAEKWAASLSIESKPGFGTSVFIRFRVPGPADANLPRRLDV